MTAMGLGLGQAQARDTATPDREVTRVTAVHRLWADPAMGLLPADQGTVPLRSVDRLQVLVMAPHPQEGRACPHRVILLRRPEGRVMERLLQFLQARDTECRPRRVMPPQLPLRPKRTPDLRRKTWKSVFRPWKAPSSRHR